MKSAEEIETEYLARFGRQMQEQSLLKFVNPDRDVDLEGVWVVYVWSHEPDNVAVGEWTLSGFRRKRNLRKTQTMGRFFSKIRRKLVIDKKAPVLLLDLATARRRATDKDQSWRFRPPQYQQRKPKMMPRAPTLINGPRQRRTRAKQKAFIFNPKTTKYIALGRRSWDKRTPGYLYLGPLKSTGKRQAQFEAQRLFRLWDERLVIATSELSKALRAALTRNRRVRAGVTRLAWPEVPPDFDTMWAKFARHLVKKEFHGAIAVDDLGMLDAMTDLKVMWEAQKRPWLTMNWFRKQINSWSVPCEKINVANLLPKKSAAKRSAPSTAGRGTRSAQKTWRRSVKVSVARPTIIQATLGRLRIVHVVMPRWVS